MLNVRKMILQMITEVISFVLVSAESLQLPEQVEQVILSFTAVPVRSLIC